MLDPNDTRIRFYVCFAVSRPKQMAEILLYWLTEMEPHDFALRFLLAIQGTEDDAKGSKKYNEMMDTVPDDAYLYLSSDDTMPFPNFLSRLSKAVAERPSIGAIVVGQDRGDTIFPACSARMIPSFACGGQMIYLKRFLGKNRYDWKARMNDSDGAMLERLFLDHPGQFMFVNETIARFNSLEWPKPATEQ